MDSEYPEDEKLLERIMAHDEALIKTLYYRYWPTFGGYLLKKGDLEENEVRDIYTDSFTILCSKIKTGKLKSPLKSALETYLIGIGKNIRLQYLDRKNRGKGGSTDDLETIPQLYQAPKIEDTFNKNEQGDLVKKLLNLLGSRCRELIRLTYLEENADDAIMEKMGFPSLGALRVKRHSCLKKLRGLLP